MEISEIKVSLSKRFRLFSIRDEIVCDWRNPQIFHFHRADSAGRLLFDKKIGKVIYL